MACDPENVISSAELTDLKSDIQTIDDVVESSLDTTTTKSGKVINTLLGQLKLLGYEVPVTYAGGIVFTSSDNTKTVDESGVIYAPLPSALPFTTSGTFVGDDDARFFVVQGDYNLRTDLAAAGGSGLVGRFDSISGLLGITPVDGATYEVKGYHSGSLVGGGAFEYDASRAQTEHNGGTVIGKDAVFPSSWSSDTEKQTWFDGPGAGTGCFVRIVKNKTISSDDFGIKSDGSNEKVPIYTLESAVFLNGYNVDFAPGTFEVGTVGGVDFNWPFRQSTFASLKDYGGVIIRGAGKNNTIFRTRSATGADVLQLNAIKGLKILDLSVTAILTATLNSGSNGVSITNGGEDLDIDVDAFDCPGVDKPSFVDGGKAYTIQNGAATNPYKNIKIRGKASGCAFAFNQDAAYEDFNTATEPNYTGIDVDIVAEDCWQGVVFGAAAATVALADENKDCDVKVRATLINCAQPVVLARWVRANVDAHIINDKTIASLFRPHAADLSVFGAKVLADFRSRVRIKGRMLECDNKLIIGGASQGGGIIGACLYTDLDFELDCPTVNTSDIDVVDSGGNTVKNSIIKLGSNVTAALPAPTPLLLVANDNRVTLGNKLTGTFIATLTGCSTSPTGSVKYSIDGNIVTLEIPEILGASASLAATLSGLPTDLYPTTTQYSTVVSQDNSVDAVSRIAVGPGTIVLYYGASTAFVATGNKGIKASTITYTRS